jgi:hypothetical protein
MEALTIADLKDAENHQGYCQEHEHVKIQHYSIHWSMDAA